MGHFNRSICLLVVAAGAALCVPQGGPRGGDPEECRPKPPTPGQEKDLCCSFPKPQPSEVKIAAMKECRTELGLPDGPPPPPGGAPPEGSQPPKPPGHRHCLEECLFKKSGLLTDDNQLIADKVTAMAIEEFGGSDDWKAAVEEAVTKCLQSPPGEVKVEGQCKSGAADFKRCLMRTMYFSCPTSNWNESAACKDEKALMERCPNMRPPHQHPPKPQ